MVGATTTFCGAAASTRFFRYSAMRKSLLSWRWRPCSLDSAPRATTTTVSGVRTCSASSHERLSRRTAWLVRADCGAEGAGGDCAEARSATPSANSKFAIRQRTMSGCAKRFLYIGMAWTPGSYAPDEAAGIERVLCVELILHRAHERQRIARFAPCFDALHSVAFHRAAFQVVSLHRGELRVSRLMKDGKGTAGVFDFIAKI